MPTRRCGGVPSGEGAKEAFDTAKRIIPFLVAMLVAISLLRHAGVVQAVTDVLRPALMAIGFPPDLLPLAAMRRPMYSASCGGANGSCSA